MVKISDERLVVVTLLLMGMGRWNLLTLECPRCGVALGNPSFNEIWHTCPNCGVEISENCPVKRFVSDLKYRSAMAQKPLYQPFSSL